MRGEGGRHVDVLFPSFALFRGGKEEDGIGMLYLQTHAPSC